jgi:4-hydroxybenzoyl-CoA thioesterase
LQILTSFVFRRQKIVEFGDCDPNGTLAIPHIYQYFDTNTWMLFEAALGVAQRDFNTTFGIMPLVEVHANYHRPLRFGETIEIGSRVSEFRRSSFHVEHRMTIDDEVAVEGGETRVWAVRNKDNAEKITALTIPQEVIARFAQVQA